MIRLNNVAFSSPSALSVTQEGFVGQSHYNTLGALVMDCLATKQKITIRWALMESAQAQQLRALTAAGNFITLSSPAGDYECLCEGCQMTMESYRGQARWRDVTVVLKER